MMVALRAVTVVAKSGLQLVFGSGSAYKTLYYPPPLFLWTSTLRFAGSTLLRKDIHLFKHLLTE